MNRLESATEEYIAAILSSEEYVTYRQELEKVKQYPELKAQIDDFRKRNFELCAQLRAINLTGGNPV